MPSLFQLWHWCWFAHGGLHPILLLVIIQRKLYRDFPIFVFYTAWTTLQSATLLAMNYAPSVSGNQYYRVDVTSSLVVAILSVAVVYEIFKHALRDYPALQDLGGTFFLWATVMLVVVAIALAWFAPANGGDHVMSVFYVLKRTLNLLLCGLLVFVFIASRYFGLSWRSYPFGIALGLGILASANLAAFAIRSQIQPIERDLSENVLDLITQGTTLCSVTVWTAYLALPERKPASLRTLPDHDLESWNQELRRLLEQ